MPIHKIIYVHLFQNIPIMLVMGTINCCLVELLLKHVSESQTFKGVSLLHVKAKPIYLRDRNQATGVKLFVPEHQGARPYREDDRIKDTTI